MSKRNPYNSPHVQAILDMMDRGMQTFKVAEAYTRLNSDTPLRTDLKKVWASHLYPEKSMVYAQLGMHQQLYSLSDAALRIIMLLGMYCHQSGLIQAKLDDICTAVSVGRSSAKKAITELCECGALIIKVPSAQHSAPIYRVNPRLMHKGARRKSCIADFESELSIPPEKYIFNQDPALVAKTDTVRTDTMTYARLQLVAFKAETQTAKKRPSRKKAAESDSQIPGQMSIDDFIEKEAVGDE